MPETQLNYAEIRAKYVERDRPLPSALEEMLRADPRAAAKRILEAVERRRRENRSEGQRLRNILRYERALWSRGVVHVAGVDEAGMSPLAGPVAAGAVIFQPGFRLTGVDDSKKLDARERERLAPAIRTSAVAWAVAFVEPEEIDRINIYWAGLLAMQRAIDALGIAPEHLLIDGRKLKSSAIAQQRIFQGDAKSLTIAAASILAKTARDARMRELHAQYPDYGFAKHKGYPVKAHIEALERHGACAIHRRSFAPVRQVLGLPPLPPWPDPHDSGRAAEVPPTAEAEGPRPSTFISISLCLPASASGSTPSPPPGRRE
jgi:ribonuclease HII